MSEPLGQDLKDLWASADVPDADRILDRLSRINARARRTHRMMLAASAGILVILALEEALSMLNTRGWISASWLGVVVANQIYLHHARDRLARRFALRPEDRLGFAINRARAGLMSGRCLYAGLPAGMLIGGAFLLASHAVHAAGPQVDGAYLRLLGLGFAALSAMLAVAMVVVGIRLARQSKQDLAELLMRRRQWHSTDEGPASGL